MYNLWNEHPSWEKLAKWLSPIAGGAFFVVAGFLGYTTGRQDVRLPRWQPEIDWTEVAIGLAMLIYGVYQYRRQRRSPNPRSVKESPEPHRDHNNRESDQEN